MPVGYPCVGEVWAYVCSVPINEEDFLYGERFDLGYVRGRWYIYCVIEQVYHHQVTDTWEVMVCHWFRSNPQRIVLREAIFLGAFVYTPMGRGVPNEVLDLLHKLRSLEPAWELQRMSPTYPSMADMASHAFLMLKRAARRIIAGQPVPFPLGCPPRIECQASAGTVTLTVTVERIDPPSEGRTAWDHILDQDPVKEG